MLRVANLDFFYNRNDYKLISLIVNLFSNAKVQAETGQYILRKDLPSVLLYNGWE